MADPTNATGLDNFKADMEDKSAATAALVAVAQKWRAELETLMEAALS